MPPAISSKRAISNHLFRNAVLLLRARVAHSLCTEFGLPHQSGAAGRQRVNRNAMLGVEMNEKVLADLSERMARFAAGNPARDLQRNFRAMLSSAFTRLELVSREEYDIQAQVLARAREKLTALERRVAELEARIPPNAD